MESKVNVPAENKFGKIEDEIGFGEDAAEKSHILVAYFAWAENVIPDEIDAMTSASVKSPGNVAQLAQWIGSKTGGDLPYPADWDACLSCANKEKAEGIHPALSKLGQSRR